AARLDRQQRDAAAGIVSDEQGAAGPLHAYVARRAASRRLLVQPGERASRSVDREGADHARLLELVDSVEHAPVRVHTKEGRVCAGVYRPDSHQLAGPPVHADEINALGIRPDIEEIRIRSSLGQGRQNTRARRGWTGSRLPGDRHHIRRDTGGRGWVACNVVWSFSHWRWDWRVVG